MDLRPHIERFSRRFGEVEAALSDPHVFDNPQRAQELSKEYARLKDLTRHGQAYLKTLSDLAENRALLKTESSDSELVQMAREEIARLEDEEHRLALEVQRGPTTHSARTREPDSQDGRREPVVGRGANCQ